MKKSFYIVSSGSCQNFLNRFQKKVPFRIPIAVNQEKKLMYTIKKCAKELHVILRLFFVTQTFQGRIIFIQFRPLLSYIF
jgi:hypothetical protein